MYNIMDHLNEIIWDPVKRGSHVPFPINSENHHFISLKSVLQNGPQCGFAALSMLASHVGLDLHPDDLTRRAKMKNLTNCGELFSAEELAIFAQEIFHMKYDVTLKDDSIRGKCYEIKNHLLNNNLILIPYDCDFNNEPCLKNGAAAHWAVLCGFLDGGCEDDFFVLACHGKSKFVSAWRFSHLQSSNDNLFDLGEKRQLDENSYVVPVGGLRRGLSSKWILFVKI